MQQRLDEQHCSNFIWRIKLNVALGFCEQGSARPEQRSAGLWGTKAAHHTVLRAGPQRGMMGSNKHIITSSVWAVSDVRGIKEACRVHTQAASLCRTVALMCGDRKKPPPCGTQSHLLLWDVHQHARSDTQSQKRTMRLRGSGGVRSEVIGSTEEVLTSIKEQEVRWSPCAGWRGGGAKTQDNHC